jgi:hypothetical protein
MTWPLRQLKKLLMARFMLASGAEGIKEGMDGKGQNMTQDSIHVRTPWEV